MINKFDDNRGSLTVVSDKKYDQILVSENPKKFTFRGMHYQTNPEQIKTVQVIQGQILDFVYNRHTKKLEFYDLTPSSDLLIVEEGMAHGYITLKPNTIVLYGVEGKWNPESEHSIPWNEIPTIKYMIQDIIKDGELIISEKDKIGK